jgi:hypothetical protein
LNEEQFYGALHPRKVETTPDLHVKGYRLIMGLYIMDVRHEKNAKHIYGEKIIMQS